MGKRFIVIIIILIAAFAGILWSSKKDAQAPEGANSQAQVSNHVTGNGTSGVTLVEYADFQCPGCAGVYPIVKEVVEKYKEQITFQFINFPLVQIHQNAMAAHRAAEAASLQNKFWEMYDLIYSGHTSWSQSNAATAVFQSYAQQLNLNMDQFNADVASSAVNDVIQADMKKGQTEGVEATPTFYLNGQKLAETPQTVEDFSKLIDEAISNSAPASEQTQETTTPQ